MASKSIAEELMCLVSEYDYVSVIPCLDTRDFVTLKEFCKTDLGKVFVINRDGCIRAGRINNNHLFSMFGKYSHEDPDSVRSDTITRLETGSRVYSQVGTEFFEYRKTNFREWALTSCSQYYYGDELLLFALCRIFHCHAIVVCRDRYWCTGNFPDNMCLDEILANCDLHLIYLRPGIFGELRLKKKFGETIPMISPPEFPVWSTEDSQNSTDDSLGNSTNNLLLTFLNVNPDNEALNLQESVNQDSINSRNDISGEPDSNDNTPIVHPDIETPNHHENIRQDNIISGNGITVGPNNTVNTGHCTMPSSPNPRETPLTGGNTLSDHAYAAPPVGDSLDKTSEEITEHALAITDTLENHAQPPVNASINPISLKENCIHVLCNHTHKDNPPSLMDICVDVMSWNPSVKYHGALNLPKSAYTLNNEIELRYTQLDNHVFGQERNKYYFMMMFM